MVVWVWRDPATAFRENETERDLMATGGKEAKSTSLELLPGNRRRL